MSSSDSRPSGVAGSNVDRRNRTWPLLCLLAIVAGSAWYVSGRPFDFEVYHVGAAGVFDGTRPVYGESSGVGWPRIYRYPPLFLFLFAPFLLLPLPAACGLWVALKYLAVGKLLPRLRDHLGGGEWTYAPYLVLALLAGPHVLEDFRYGNVQMFIVAMVSGAMIIRKTRPLLASGVLALAVSIKVWPLFFVPLLCVRREWRVVVATLLTTLLLTLIPAFYFGWSENLALIEEWYRQEGAIQAGSEEIWFPSQSLRGVMMRYTTVIDYSRVPDSNYPQINLVDFNRASVRNAWLATASVFYMALLFMAPRSGPRWEATGIGIAFCALTLLQPFAQKYAFSALFWPACVAAAFVTEAGPKPRWARNAVVVATVLVCAQIVLPDAAAHRLAQVIGVDFAAAVCLTAALVGFHCRRELEGRRSAQ